MAFYLFVLVLAEVQLAEVQPWVTLPEGCLPGDGGPPIAIHVFSENPPTLKTTLGSLGAFAPVAPGLHRAEYLPASVQKPAVERIAGPGLARPIEVRVCPAPAGSIAAKSNPAQLLAGRGERAIIDIAVADPDGRPVDGAPLQLAASIGALGPIEALGGGRYKTTFTPPDHPYPEVAIVMIADPGQARLERVAVARVLIPITAEIRLPGKTVPGTQMEMAIAGERFGPVRADPRGQFELMVRVPPGYGAGQATSMDQAGNRKTRPVDFFLPETNQLGLWAYPLRLPAAEGEGRPPVRSRLLVTTIDRYGAPVEVPSRDLKLVVRRGRLGHHRHLRGGFVEAYYTPPAVVGDGRDLIQVSFLKAGQKSRAEAAIEIQPGPAAQVALTAPESIPAGATAQVDVRVSDRAGNPVRDQLVALTFEPGELSEVSAVSTVSEVPEAAPGLYRAKLAIPSAPVRWQARLRAVVRDRSGESPARILVVPQTIAFAIEVILVDALGLPVPEQPIALLEPTTREARTDAFGRARFPIDPDAAPSRWTFSAGSVRRSVFIAGEPSGPRLLEVGLDRSAPSAAEFTREATVRIYPASEVSLALEVSREGAAFRIAIAVTGPDGTPVVDRALQVDASLGSVGPIVPEGEGRYLVRWTPPGPGFGRATLTVTDLAARVAALTSIAEDL